MATTTFTPAQSWYSSKVNATGPTVEYFSKTVTASAVWGKILFAKIPHGACILDGVINSSTAWVDFRAGIGTTSASNDVMFIGTTSAVTVARFYTGSTVPALVGYEVSVSDDNLQRWVYLTGAASASLSGVISGWIMYDMSGGQQTG